MRRRQFLIGPDGKLIIQRCDRWDLKLSLIAWFVLFGSIGLVIGLTILAIMATAAGAATCRHEPERKGAWGWRMIDGQKCWFEGRRVIPKDQLRWPQQVAADMPPEKPSWLERSSDKAGPAEIYFLSTVNGRSNPLEAYPPLIWQQPWLTPNSIMNWPLLLDIDRTPFAAWDKRIGE